MHPNSEAVFSTDRLLRGIIISIIEGPKKSCQIVLYQVETERSPRENKADRQPHDLQMNDNNNEMLMSTLRSLALSCENEENEENRFARAIYLKFNAM